ncbi:MAG TPA: DUF4861 family protein [Verrucomicrobiae bacterium]|nr:DUF4861 family protein [Verrucomicrobiae bacterium]
MITTKLLPLALCLVVPALAPAATQLTVTAVNKLQLSRPSQTIEVSGRDLTPLGTDLTRIHVRDAAGGELLVQAVDSDGDTYRTPDQLIFQADFAPGESKTFTLTQGNKHVYSLQQFKAFGRFNRERFDDFAWENDRIAHRTYGKALETWEGEPLSSSTIDIWSKRTGRMVLNDWYLADDYHTDHGDGADFYSAGLSRGNGGSGLWADERLWVSRNFVNSRVLANGPIRVLFELVYEPFNVNGISVAEVKRVSLDAGQQLDHYVSTFKPFTRPNQPATLTAAAGLKKVSGEQLENNAERGWIVKWERVEKNAGNQGLAVVADPASVVKSASDNLNQLLLLKVTSTNTVSYWAGFCWDRAGHFTTPDAWKNYVEEFSQGLASPIAITVK